MFMTTLILGVVIMLSSKTWFSVWLGLEINLMSFLPIILFSSTSGSEGGLKYFLIQAMGSLIILQASLSWFILPCPYLFLAIPLILKLGAAPLHFWLPDVTKTLPWRINMVLLTLQKTGPLYLLATITTNHKSLLLLVSIFSALVGSLGGLNEMDLRKLMAFSSISHMGWMFAGMALTQAHWILYFLTYSVTSLTLMFVMEKNSMSSLSQLTTKDKNSILMMLLFLSLGGFPPLLGFAPKWAILMSTSSLSLPLTILLIATSVLTLYYYIRAGLLTLTLSSMNFKTNLLVNNYMQMLLIFINMLGGGLYMLLWSSLVL
uniref:NADH-ubiquinone oxidoreductase chain 2 n=1 Tax=Proasellus assaforensis TaxID=1282049 RepID=A0A485M7B5_9CRUS|nr:NADH dehydrogenase subunit 2 [Proasellus assaforensis]